MSDQRQVNESDLGWYAERDQPENDLIKAAQDKAAFDQAHGLMEAAAHPQPDAATQPSSPAPEAPLPNCHCGRRVLVESGCEGCNFHPMDCGCANLVPAAPQPSAPVRTAEEIALAYSMVDVRETRWLTLHDAVFAIRAYASQFPQDEQLHGFSERTHVDRMLAAGCVISVNEKLELIVDNTRAESAEAQAEQLQKRVESLEKQIKFNEERHSKSISLLTQTLRESAERDLAATQEQVAALVDVLTLVHNSPWDAARWRIKVRDALAPASSAAAVYKAGVRAQAIRDAERELPKFPGHISTAQWLRARADAKETGKE